MIRAIEMGQQVKVHATKLHDLSLITRIIMEEEKSCPTIPVYMECQ